MVTRYSINLADQGKEGASLYKDRRITNRKNLETIHEVSTLLMRSLDIHEICQRIMEALFQNLPRIESGAILLTYEVEAEGFREIIGRARDPKKVHEAKYSRTIVNRVIREGKAPHVAFPEVDPLRDLPLRRVEPGRNEVGPPAARTRGISPDL